jgi:hypothetical protein
VGTVGQQLQLGQGVGIVCTVPCCSLLYIRHRAYGKRESGCSVYLLVQHQFQLGQGMRQLFGRGLRCLLGIWCKAK